MTDKEQVIIEGKGCTHKTWDAECSLTGDHHGDNMKPCKFIDEKSCYFKQLKRKNAEYNKIAVLLRDTDIYSQVCETCRDEILIYPSISGKTNYTDNEVDIITLRGIINRLKNKEQKCKELEQECEELENKIKKLRKNLALEIEINDRYRKALVEIEEVCLEDTRTFADGTTVRYDALDDILDIINKAKGDN